MSDYVNFTSLPPEQEASFVVFERHQQENLKKGFTVGLGVVGSIAWSNATSFSFVAVPLFVFMSAVLLHSGIGRGLYTAVARWVAFLPGGLAVASVFSCAIFAAVSGSSVATAATIGMIGIPEMERRGYARPLICGSLAAGGTLGILSMPSAGPALLRLIDRQGQERSFPLPAQP